MTCPWLGDGVEHPEHHRQLHAAIERLTDENARLRQQLQKSDRSWAVDP